MTLQLLFLLRFLLFFYVDACTTTAIDVEEELNEWKCTSAALLATVHLCSRPFPPAFRYRSHLQKDFHNKSKMLSCVAYKCVNRRESGKKYLAK